MANLHLVTGYAGTEHVTAADQGAFHALTMGSGQCVINTGNQFATSIVTNNKVKVLDGEIYMHGRYIRLEPNTYAELAIESGEQGKYRNDLIVARYIKGLSTGVEEANLVVIKGTSTESTPSDPAYITGNILNGDAQNDIPLFRVVISGLTITGIEKLFTAKDFDLDRKFDSKQNCTDLLAEENAIADADHIPFYDASVKGHRKILWSKVKAFFAKAVHRHDISDIDNVATVAPYLYAIGDTLTTTRTNLNDKWALCNGDVVYRDSGKLDREMYEMLDEGFNDRKIYPFHRKVSGYPRFTHLKDGKWCAAYYNGRDGAAVYDSLTGEIIEIGRSGDSIGSSGAYGYIIGIVWNGNQYVMCSLNGNTFYFYTSNNLETWTQAATHKPSSYEPGYDNTYGVMRFVWDGVAYRVAAQYNGYQAHYLHTYDVNFNYKGCKSMNEGDIYATDGLFCIGYGYDAYIYEPGSTDVLVSPSAVSSDGSHSVYVKYAENQYVLVPINYLPEYIRFYDKSANKKTTLDASKLGYSYIKRVHLDTKTNELVLVLASNNNNGIIDKTAFARIAVGADKTVKENYTITENTVVNSAVYVDFINDGSNWIYLYGNYGGEVKVAGAHPRTLPTISLDKVYTYIKVKEGA